MLQHRLQIYKGPKMVDDEEILGVNELEDVGIEKTKDETLHHLRDYLREQPRGQQRDNRLREV